MSPIPQPCSANRRRRRQGRCFPGHPCLLLGVLLWLPGLLLCLPAPAATLLVWPDSPSPSTPYADWGTAAHTIQEAVDAAQPGDTVLVTNGIYATGGRAVYGLMTNRLAVTKPVRVQSVNGPEVTVIQGRQVAGATNGDGAIRCVYLANGAFLAGFTLSNGATRTGGDIAHERSGGGVWCESTNALVSNCVLTANAANYAGGGAYGGALDRCVLTANWASGGGGACSCGLHSSALFRNHADNGGGAQSCALNNCTLAQNNAINGGGVNASSVQNSIVWSNTATSAANYTADCLFNYSCTSPMPATRTGNLDFDPQFEDDIHLAATSPCIGQGSSAAASLDFHGRELT